MILFVIISLIGAGVPAPAQAAANTNPSLEEIALIFDKVAQEKQIPAVILKTIAYVESGWRQWDANGNTVAGYWGSKPNLGIMQVSSYRAGDTETINKLKNDIEYNIRCGADVLNSKWDATPRIGNGERDILENWYFAIWAYHSWNTSNNPNTAKKAGREAYQDKVLRWAGTNYYEGLVNPVKITPIPASLIPAGTLPSKNSTWKTPEPYHTVEFPPVFSAVELELLQSTHRISGQDRIETAVRIAERGWSGGFDTVILARSEDFPDALAGAALAKKYNAPILLTAKDNLDPRVAELIKARQPGAAIILGGDGAVSAQVETALRELMSWTTDIRRIAGKDRFETAALIADEFPADSDLAIAAGYNFPDALSLASTAAASETPLLLVTKDNLPEAAAAALETRIPGKIYIAGGDGVVSGNVVDQIRAAAAENGISEDSIIQFKGQDRYDTAVQVVSAFYPEALKMYLVTGENFPDALAGAALAANSNAPLLLVPRQDLSAQSAVGTYLAELPYRVEIKFEVIGGNAAVNDKCVVMVREICSGQ